MVDPYMDRITAYVLGELEPETDSEQERYTAGGADLARSKKDDDDEEEGDEKDD
jgi:anti-sigma factor RsiW